MDSLSCAKFVHDRRKTGTWLQEAQNSKFGIEERTIYWVLCAEVYADRWWETGMGTTDITKVVDFAQQLWHHTTIQVKFAVEAHGIGSLSVSHAEFSDDRFKEKLCESQIF